MMRGALKAVVTVAFLATTVHVGHPTLDPAHADASTTIAAGAAPDTGNVGVLAANRSQTAPAASPARAATVARYQHPNLLVERWHDLAIAAGWTEQQWPRLSCIIARESHGIPSVWNRRDPGYGSLGLAQINMSRGRYGTWALYRARLSGQLTALLDPAVNLSIAHDLYLRAAHMWGNGWRPWGRGC